MFIDHRESLHQQHLAEKVGGDGMILHILGIRERKDGLVGIRLDALLCGGLSDRLPFGL